MLHSAFTVQYIFWWHPGQTPWTVLWNWKLVMCVIMLLHSFQINYDLVNLGRQSIVFWLLKHYLWSVRITLYQEVKLWNCVLGRRAEIIVSHPDENVYGACISSYMCACKNTPKGPGCGSWKLASNWQGQYLELLRVEGCVDPTALPWGLEGLVSQMCEYVTHTFNNKPRGGGHKMC